MKFIPIIDEEIDLTKLKNEYKNGRAVGKVTLGSQHFFFKQKFSVKYIAFADIYRAFRRVQCVNVRMCCANGELQLNNIVICSKKEELAMIDFSTEKEAVAVLEYMEQNWPEIKIGTKK